MRDALQTEKLYLRRGSFMVCNVNLRVEMGQMLAIGGKGGAGKSTLVRGIGGALDPEAGRITYWGKELCEDEARIRRQMSVVYDEPNFNTELKADRLARELAKYEPFFDREAFLSYMEQMELDIGQRVKLYAPDMQKKLMLILAVCRGPQLLVIDEPTRGADADAKKWMWDMIEDYRERTGAAVVYTTHHEEEILRADSAVYLKNGAVVQKEAWR